MADMMKLVKELGAANAIKTVEIERLKSELAKARAEALEEAWRVTVIHTQYPITTDFDRGYDKGRKDAADRIRALKDKPYVPTDSGEKITP